MLKIKSIFMISDSSVLKLLNVYAFTHLFILDNVLPYAINVKLTLS